MVQPGKVQFDAPPGTYLLKDSSIQYILTSSRMLDLSRRRFGRPDRGGDLVQSPSGHPADINVSGLEPARASPFSTSLHFTSLDIEESGSFFLTSPLAPGQTSVVDPTAEYSSEWGSIPRFSPAQGTTAWVLQRTVREAETPADATEPWRYRTIVRSAALEPFSFDGEVFRIQATLQPTPQQQVRFDLRRDEFAAQREDSATGSSSASLSVLLYPWLNHPRDGSIDFSTSSLLFFSPPRNEPQTPLVRELSFGNPYPSPWEPLALFSLSYGFTITNHDASRSLPAAESFVVFEPLSSLSADPVRPRVSLPRDIRVDGVPAQTARILGSATPVVSWAPPTLGPVTGYMVVIQHYPASASVLRTVARIYTGPDPDDRSVRVPPGVLSSGNEYFVRVSAIYAPGVTPELSGRSTAVPYGTATSFSSLLTVP